MRRTTGARPLLLADLGDALLWSGRFEEAEAALGEAIELAREGRRRADTRARAALADAARFQVDPDADYEALEEEGLEAAALCEASGDDFGAARAARRLLGSLGPLQARTSGRRPSARTSTTGARRTSTIRRTT